MRKKKGELSIEFTFLIFLAVIVVMVIITLIIKFGLSGNNLFCKIAGTCGGPENGAIPDNQLINLSTSTCGTVMAEMVKGAKLCFERIGDLADQDEEVCYTILTPGCAFTAIDQTAIQTQLATDGINSTFGSSLADRKIVIAFMRQTRAINFI